MKTGEGQPVLADMAAARLPADRTLSAICCLPGARDSAQAVGWTHLDGSALVFRPDRAYLHCMCEFCIQHGAGRKWYLEASNYSADLLKNPRKIRRLAARLSDVTAPGSREVSRLTALLRAPFLGRKCLIICDVAHWTGESFHEYGDDDCGNAL